MLKKVLITKKPALPQEKIHEPSLRPGKRPSTTKFAFVRLVLILARNGLLSLPLRFVMSKTAESRSP